MPIDNITQFTTFLVALSIASERLVEIIKGLFPWLDQAKSDTRMEGLRRSGLQALAVLSGIVTAYLVSPMIPKQVSDAVGGLGYFPLGLLASGGSGFWNSILNYVTKLKDIKR